MNPPNLGMPQGVWAYGDQLIVSHNAAFPPYCIKCGRPAEGQRFRKRFSWHPMWVYIFVIVALLIYVILAAVMSKRMKLELPLCAQHMEKYRMLRVAAAVLLLGSIPEMIVAGTYLPDNYMGFGIAAGICALIAGVVCLILFNNILGVKGIDEFYGYFGNASQNFLATLPPPPPGMMLPR